MSKILNLPAEPNHVINYIDTDTFQFFIYWLRDKLIKEGKYEDRQIIGIIIQAMFESYKYNNEFQEFQKQREEDNE